MDHRTKLAQYHREESARVHGLLESTRDMEPDKRRTVLENELHAQKTARELMVSDALESVSLLFGGGTSQSYITEDPRSDDGEVWNEIGITGRVFSRGGLHRRALTRIDLDHAREIGRWLAEENEYVIGSMENRISYTVGEGLVWSLVPRAGRARDPRLHAAGMEALEAFRDRNDMSAVEQEKVRRDDRDGEAILRGYANAEGPYLVRFTPPELLEAPAFVPDGLPARARQALALGVEVDPFDPGEVLGYHVRPEYDQEAVYVPVDTGMGLRHVYHSKLNVDMECPRGWPTYWPIRKNMARAEKLLRNMSYVAALQAAIALIRKHKISTKAEVESMIRNHADLITTNRTLGRTDNFRGVRPGTVIDGGPGVDLEAPVSSVNAGNNVQVLSADLRAGAVAVGQPDFMFSGQVGSAGYASLTIAEGPHHKRVKRDQGRNRRLLTRVHEDALRHEIFWERLSPDLLDRYRLQVEFPDPLVRDQLQQTQRYQIMHGAGALSKRTWLGREGFNPDEEERFNRQAAGAGATPAGAPAGGGGEDPVQDLAMNGPQVTALQGIVAAVAAGEIGPQQGEQLILVAFPTVSPEQARTLTSGGRMTVFPSTPAPRTPAPGPGLKPPPGSTPGGPGGADQAGNLEDPASAAGENF